VKRAEEPRVQTAGGEEHGEQRDLRHPGPPRHPGSGILLAHRVLVSLSLPGLAAGEPDESRLGQRLRAALEEHQASLVVAVNGFGSSDDGTSIRPPSADPEKTRGVGAAGNRIGHRRHVACRPARPDHEAGPGLPCRAEDGHDGTTVLLDVLSARLFFLRVRFRCFRGKSARGQLRPGGLLALGSKLALCFFSALSGFPDLGRLFARCRRRLDFRLRIPDGLFGILGKPGVGDGALSAPGQGKSHSVDRAGQRELRR
jgi:hypothetical protein